MLESRRRRGIGGRLILDGLAHCRAAGFGWAVVLAIRRITDASVFVRQSILD